MDDTKARQALMQMLFGYMAAQAIHAAARLCVADALRDGARTSEALAAAVGADPTALHRLLRALACLGVVAETAPGTFVLTPLGQPLRADAPSSVRSLAMLFCDDAVWRSWGHLVDSVRTGEVAFERELGIGTFEYFARNPELSAIFNAAMAEDARNVAPSVIAAHDFGRLGALVDVGGGNGTLLGAILAANPTLRGILLDTPAGVERAPEVLESAGVASRCRVVAGDFFTEVPAGGDAYLMKSVLHDWDDARAAAVLLSCRRAMKPDGRLLVVEPVMPPRVESPAIAGMVMSDLNMLVVAGGSERTEAEFRALLGDAGFALERISPPLAPTNYRLLEGRPA